MKMSKKIGDTSIRVLETLKFLYKNNASVQDIIYYFEKHDPNKKIYTSEVILKYINTLKVFGFKFAKDKDKYILLNYLIQFDFNENDLKAIYILEKFAQLFPEEKIRAEINKFLQELEKRFNDNTNSLFQNIKKNNPVKFKFIYDSYLDKIKQYEKYCIDEQKLKISYKNQNKTETSLIVEPNEIKYAGNEVYFRVYNPVSAQIQDINFNSIIKIEQLPLKSNRTSMLSSITFKLKDRLAKAYKLHEGEKLLQINLDNSITVLNQKEDRMLLLKRLMRYGENCELISPKDLREEMKKLIRATLSNYS